MAAQEPRERVSLQSLVRWKGLMDDATKGTRIASEVFMGILAFSMVSTQTNYFVVGNTHVIAVLAPIAATALLFGAVPATVIGFVAGLTEMLHARYLPLDAYEAYFAAPTNSVVLFSLMGGLLGILFALSDHYNRDKGDRRGLLALLGTCLLGSFILTFLFSVSVNVINALYNLEVPKEIIRDFTENREVVSQILANFVLMGGLTVIAGSMNRNREETGGEVTLRRTFQGWLAVVVGMAYLFTVSMGYTFVSSVCITSADHQIQGQIDYLTGQLQRRDQMLEGMARRSAISAEKIEELHTSTTAGIATGLPLGEHGISAVAEDGVIVSSSEQSYVGKQFEEVVGSGLVNGFDESLYDRTRAVQWYINGIELGYLRAAQIGYVRVQRSGSYQVMAVLPAEEVFAWRGWMMLGLSAAFVALFTAVYVQASLLLKNVVVKGIDETNRTLSLITQGDLDQRVSVRDSVEFVSLSAGINATVAALKNAIAAEAGRIEQDLATATAIQESALPRTFPPFPEIDAFDIYANMTPAREVGGDFYDFFLIDDHTLGFLIADVSGKGIPASLFMMAAKTELANYMGSGMELSEAMQTANWHLCQGNEAGMFVTVWAATLDYTTGELTYVNAGHNPPLLRHNGTWEWVRTRGGLFLGTYDTAKYRHSKLTLSPGDQLLLYTDGVNEAFSAKEELYSDQRLHEFLDGHTDLHPHQLVDALEQDLSAWSEGADQSDDITILSLEYGVPPEVTGSITVEATLDHLDDIIDLIHGELANRKCPIATQNQLDVAIEEMFVNVCNYAYEGADTPGSCRVDYIYRADPSTITIQITDWGVPFNPLAHQDPSKPSSIAETMIGGLGILMAKRMTDDMSYLRDGDANVVAFRKSW